MGNTRLLCQQYLRPLYTVTVILNGGSVWRIVCVLEWGRGGERRGRGVEGMRGGMEGERGVGQDRSGSGCWAQKRVPCLLTGWCDFWDEYLYDGIKVKAVWLIVVFISAGRQFGTILVHYRHLTFAVKRSLVHIFFPESAVAYCGVLTKTHPFWVVL